MQRVEIDEGLRPGRSTDDAEHIVQREREVRELRRTNATLRSAHKSESGSSRLRGTEDRPVDVLRRQETAEPSARAVSDEVALTQIRPVHSENLGIYGVRTVHDAPREGHTFARCIVERLMRRDGLRGVTRHRGPRTTVPGDPAELPLDLVDRAFTATCPDQLWVADIATFGRSPAGFTRRS